MLEHFKSIIEWYGEYGVILFRKHLHTYSKGYRGASEFRIQIKQISSSKEMFKMIDIFFSL